MGKYLLVVPSSAREGQDEAYNSWYDGVHTADLLSLPGVKSCRRFDAMATSPHSPPGRYLALIEIEADDPMAMFAEMERRGAAGEMAGTDTIDPESWGFWLYKPQDESP